MKKIVSSLLLGSLLLSTVASADFTRIEAGVGAWSYKPSGYLSYTDNYGTLRNDSLEKDQTSAYAWIFIKHPIPVIPNLRLEYTTLHDDGKASGSYDGIYAPLGTPSSWDLTQYDVIPYYNILDNTFWTTIDIGIDVKFIESDYTAKGVSQIPGANILSTVTGIPTDYNEKDNVIVPLAYLRGRIEIPTTNLGLETDAKYISYDDNTAYDIRAKIDYTFDSVPVVQPAIEVGYRIQKYDITSDDKKTKIDMDFSGGYLGIMARF
ncbi:hypothetical protein MNB_SM-5-736 [hydrothermal vent metagenome]|uniref:Outer membrane protein n=1 Tax=hydrothermal vent metagenome TaxID=652676 RepID=A0A1W1CVT8_9ZZZZ